MALIEIKMIITRRAEVTKSQYPPGYTLQDIIDSEIQSARENPEMFIDFSSEIEVTGKLVEDNE